MAPFRETTFEPVDGARPNNSSKPSRFFGLLKLMVSGYDRFFLRFQEDGNARGLLQWSEAGSRTATQAMTPEFCLSPGESLVGSGRAAAF